MQHFSSGEYKEVYCFIGLLRTGVAQLVGTVVSVFEKGTKVASVTL